MSKLSNKKSVMAVVDETTEGVPAFPTTSNEYTALQDGFDMEPAFNELDNAELTGAIGKAKTILGSEDPSASFSHYIRHSGVEGTEPDYGKLLYSLLGDKKIVVTERDVVSATAGTESVRGTVVVDAGEGVEFERGIALLVKDATNGYVVRNVFDVSTDTLNLGQNLANAPAALTNLGKAVLYKPANDQHPTHSYLLYRANGGAVELLAGGRVTEGSIEAAAGEFINGSFSVGGVGYYFNPVEIAASNKYVDFSEGGGGGLSEVTNYDFSGANGADMANVTFLHYAPSGTVYGILFNYNGLGAAAAPAAATVSFEVPILDFDIDFDIATAFETAVLANMGADVTTTNFSELIDLTNITAGAVTDANDDGSAFIGVITVTTQGTAGGGGELNAVVAEKTYKDPHELAAALQTAMDDLAVGNITVVYQDVDGKYKLTSDGATFDLLWDTGVNVGNNMGTTLGFSIVADDTGALTYTGDNASVLSSPDTPNYDDSQPLVAKDNEVMIGDFSDIECFEASSVNMSINGTKSDIPSICAPTGKAGSIISEREVEVEIAALLDKYDADKFRRFRKGDNIQFTYNFGEKSGGNWVPGKTVNVYMPTSTISSYKLEDADGLVQLSMTLKGYVNEGLGEFYINFL